MPNENNSKFEFGVGHDFANAVFYSLSDHPLREQGARGIVIPINEDVWKRVLEKVFPEKYDNEPPQKLAAYCSYFRLGKHGIGYDKRGRRDFARGTRVKPKDRGKQGGDVSKNPKRAIWPRTNYLIDAAEVIKVAVDYMKAHHPDWSDARKHLIHIDANGNELDTAPDSILLDPIRKEMLIEAFERRASWARLARKLYGYECMVPGCKFVLLKEDGESYIEVHHINAMYEGGSPNDKMNLSVLCPNHHREVHYATADRRKELTTLIRREQARRLAAFGV